MVEKGTEEFGLPADLAIVDRKPRTKDDVVDPVKGGSTKPVLLGHCREGSREGIVGDGENEVVLGANVFGKG